MKTAGELLEWYNINRERGRRIEEWRNVESICKN